MIFFLKVISVYKAKFNFERSQMGKEQKGSYSSCKARNVKEMVLLSLPQHNLWLPESGSAAFRGFATVASVHACHHVRRHLRLGVHLHSSLQVSFLRNLGTCFEISTIQSLNFSPTVALWFSLAIIVLMFQFPITEFEEFVFLVGLTTITVNPRDWTQKLKFYVTVVKKKKSTLNRQKLKWLDGVVLVLVIVKSQKLSRLS